MSKLNSLNLPTAKLQENPIVNDLSVLSKNFPPPTTPGAVLIGPEAEDPGTAPGAPELSLGFNTTNVNGKVIPAGAQYFTLPVQVMINDVPTTKYLVLASNALVG